MRTEPLLLLLATAATAASATAVQINLHKGRPGDAARPSTVARRATSKSSAFVEALVNNKTGGGYYADVTVGTPPQPQTLVVDTGSSDVWVVSSEADLCTMPRKQATYGDSCSDTYTSSKSSTYKLLDKNGFKITYLDKSEASGDFIADTFRLGDISVTSLQIGLATKAQRGTGVMGLSYRGSESANTTYPTLLEELVTQGQLGTRAYSLYLNDYRADTGALLFGGIDTDKFIGPLYVLPVLKTQTNGIDSGNDSDSDYTVLAVALTSLEAGATENDSSSVSLGANNGGRLPAILDSGTTLSYFPASVTRALYNVVGAYDDTERSGVVFADCASTATVRFTFGGGNSFTGGDGSTGITISVPASQLVLDVFSDSQDEIPSYVPFDNTCLFGILPSTSAGGSDNDESLALLGDTFLRAAYAVYDLSHNQIGLAPANFNSSTSTLVELSSTLSGLPTTLTGVKSQKPYTPTATASATSGVVTVTASAHATSKSGAAPAPPTGGGRLAVIVVSCLMSILGGLMVLA